MFAAVTPAVGSIVSAGTISPIASPDTALMLPSLVGTWTRKDEWKQLQAITVAGPHGLRYDVTFVADAERTRFVGAAVRLGDQLFLDLEPVLSDIPPALRKMVLPVHVVMRVDVSGDNLRLSHWSLPHLREVLRDPKRTVSHTFGGPLIICLTGETAEVQRFLRDHARVIFQGPVAEYRRAEP